MAKYVKYESQGPIIDELYEIRGYLWDKYKGDMKKMCADASKLPIEKGMKKSKPPKAPTAFLKKPKKKASKKKPTRPLQIHST